MFAAAQIGESVVVPEAPAADSRHVYNQFTIRCRQRDELREHLRAAGIPTEIYYPVPLHLQPAFSYLGHKAGDFPVSESASAEALSLPVFPELTEAHQQSVVDAIAKFYGRAN
jgi:dTDP-4-amino-4,6-dideoxygalactose transaminase